MKHVKISAIFCVLAMTLAACAKSSNSSRTSSSFLSSNQFVDGYFFEAALGDCDTDHKTFSGTTADSVQKQMCEALQDHKLNNSCAEFQRKDFFEKKCPGYVWTPKYEDGMRPAVRDQDKEYRIREALAHMVVENFDVANDLSSSDKKALRKFMTDSHVCTMSYVGPRCLDHSVMHGTPVGSFHDLGEESVFIVELTVDGVKTPLLYVFRLLTNETSFKSVNFKIYKQLRPFPGALTSSETIRNYLTNKSSTNVVATAELAPNAIAAALARLSNTEDAREAYHMAKLVVQEAAADHEARTQLPIALIARKDAIASSNFPEHHSRLISLFANDPKSSPQQMVDFCDALLDANDPAVREMAAVYVLALDNTRELVKPTVRAALSHDHWNIRRIAVLALAGANPSTNDQNLVLGKLQDSDSDVRAEVTKAAEKMTLSNAHVPTLTALTKAGTWETRREATRLLGLVSDGSADDSLIAQISDDDGDIRMTAFEALDARALDESHVPALVKIFSGKSWRARLDAAKLLGKIKGEKSVKALQSQLAVETDADVKAQLEASLAAARG